MQYHQDLSIYQLNFAQFFQDLNLEGQEIFGDDDQRTHTIKIGHNLDHLPLLPEIKGLRPLKKEKIENYFKGFEYERFKCVNGQLTDPLEDCYYCDYCSSDISDLSKKESDPHKYVCLDCYTDMCHLCYSEKSEEDALKNGAKNYHLRKEKLQKCHQNHTLIKIPVSTACWCTCDVCEETLYGDYYWTDYNHENPDDRYDLCYKCAEKDSSLITKKRLRKVQLPGDVYYTTQFGNLADWIPIYVVVYPTRKEIQAYVDANKIEDYSPSDYEYDNDSYGKYIYYNINKDSSNYQKLAISTVDDHGRSGIYAIRKFQSLEDLKKEIEPEAETMLKESVQGGWHTVYNNSISLLMDKLKMAYHFG